MIGEVIANTNVIRYLMAAMGILGAVSYTHLRAHETDSYLVCRLLLEKKKKKRKTRKKKKKKASD